jgi:hypothetical protein
MTELERARAHLRDQQESLAIRRCLAAHARFVGDWQPLVRNAENAVLAALNWVWEEQCRWEFGMITVTADGWGSKNYIPEISP